MRRLGILGGTFDPIHLGHLAMAQVALEKMKLDKIFFVPCHLPPHKSGRGVTPAVHRYEMVRLAIRGNRRFAVSLFEIEKAGKSYTIDTVRHFSGLFPGERLFFIVGFDNFMTLKSWRRVEEILEIVDFVVVNRPLDPCHKWGGRGRSAVSLPHHRVSMPEMDISSSYVRERIRQKKNVRFLVPEAVARYIEKNHLYRKNDQG